MKSVKERFLEYVAFDTQSEDCVDAVPSTAKQFVLAKYLFDELESMGASDVFADEHAYVYAHIPGNNGSDRSLGFIAHMDTSPALSGFGVRPRVIENYDGADIVLNKEKNIVMSVEAFPELKGFCGQELIVTDGTTLLGADDKAGVAEIMAMAEFFLSHPEVSHGPVSICFTPDEEVGRGADFFDFERFGASCAYTVDGGAFGEIEYETFNAASARVKINGASSHPGDAKGKMINALTIARELDTILPQHERPQFTEGYEGFFHLDSMAGSVETAGMDYLIRDHDRNKFEARKDIFRAACDKLNEKYGEGTVELNLTDSYYNMKDVLVNYMFLIDNACDALRELGAEPVLPPVRGGTDGCRLSYEGLPCPNLCTGGGNYHGKYEYAVVASMEKTVELLIKLASKGL